MKILTASVKAVSNLVELIVIGDTHIGSANFNEGLLHQTIEYVKEEPNRYIILNGDILDTNFKDSPGSVYDNQLSPSVALATAHRIFEPVADRIIATLGGNHDHDRSMRQVDISFAQQLAVMLGIPDKFSADSVLLFLTVEDGIKGHNGKSVLYRVFISHGNNGGGGSAPSKLGALEKMSLVLPSADLFIHNHTHSPIVYKDTYYDIDDKKKCITQKERLYVNCASFLNYWNSYGEKKLMKPQSQSLPIIKLRAYRNHTRFEDRIRKVLSCEL